MSKSLADEIRSQNPPGRFLEYNPTLKLWTVIGDRRATEKVSQALRERKNGATTNNASTSFNETHSANSYQSSKNDSHDMTSAHICSETEIDNSNKSVDIDSSTSKMEVDTSGKSADNNSSQMDIINSKKNKMHAGSSLNQSPFIFHESALNREQQALQTPSPNEESTKASEINRLILNTLRKDYYFYPDKKKIKLVPSQSTIGDDEINFLIYQTFAQDHDNAKVNGSKAINNMDVGMTQSYANRSYTNTNMISRSYKSNNNTIKNSQNNQMPSLSNTVNDSSTYTPRQNLEDESKGPVRNVVSNDYLMFDIDTISQLLIQMR